MDTTTQKQWLADVINHADATLGIQKLMATLLDGTTLAVEVNPPVNVIQQDKKAWRHHLSPGVNAPLVVANEQISDGGFLLVQSTAPITLWNVCNQPANSAPGGMYFIMLWPNALADGTQQAVTRCIIDNSKCSGAIYQSPFEAAIRGKCDDFQMYGGIITAHLQPNGNQVKPIVEIRHGKSWLFKNTTFKDGWPEIGQQKTAQPDGKSRYETSQRVGTVTFDGCRFTRWADANTKSVISRKPGVDRIAFVNCVGPDGNTFSKST